jgi:hypothetical protein
MCILLLAQTTQIVQIVVFVRHNSADGLARGQGCYSLKSVSPLSLQNTNLHTKIQTYKKKVCLYTEQFAIRKTRIKVKYKEL